MAKLEDGHVVSDDGEWEYQPGGARPWRRIAGEPGERKGWLIRREEGKPGVRETFQAAEIARQERVRQHAVNP